MLSLKEGNTPIPLKNRVWAKKNPFDNSPVLNTQFYNQRLKYTHQWFLANNTSNFGAINMKFDMYVNFWYTKKCIQNNWENSLIYTSSENGLKHWWCIKHPFFKSHIKMTKCFIMSILGLIRRILIIHNYQTN